MRPLTIAKPCANTSRIYVLSYSTIDIQLNARTGFYNTTMLTVQKCARGIKRPGVLRMITLIKDSSTQEQIHFSTL